MINVLYDIWHVFFFRNTSSFLCSYFSDFRIMLDGQRRLHRPYKVLAFFLFICEIKQIQLILSLVHSQRQNKEIATTSSPIVTSNRPTPVCSTKVCRKSSASNSCWKRCKIDGNKLDLYQYTEWSVCLITNSGGRKVCLSTLLFFFCLVEEEIALKYRKCRLAKKHS